VLTMVGSEFLVRVVKWVGYREIDLESEPEPESARPIRIRRGAFADDSPRRDILISPDHRVLVGGVLIPTRLLTNGMTIVPDLSCRRVEYFHIELEQHAVLSADGLPAESFLDEIGDRRFFSNAEGPVALRPRLPGILHQGVTRLACAPLAMSAAESELAWRQIADRARTLGFVPPNWDTTSDPDLHLCADGRDLQPLLQDETRYVFALPAGAKSLRLASRATVPFDLDRAHEDWRSLGVGVTKIVYRIGAEQIEIPADHPSLIRGWHDAETDGTTVWRWTNGDAHLPLPMPIGAGGATLELHLSGRVTYAITEQAAETTRRIA